MIYDLKAKGSQCLDCGLRISDCGLKTDVPRDTLCGLSAQGVEWAAGGTKCAKRSQFSRRGWVPLPRPPALRPRPSPEAVVQNEPNSLWRRRGRRANRQNEPNFVELAGRRNTQRSTILSFHHSNPMATVQNEANFGACPVGRSLGDERVKQSQLPAGHVARASGP